MSAVIASLDQRIRERASQLFADFRDRNHRETSRVFVWLFLGQWLFAIVVALVLSPYTWAGKVHSMNVHVPTAILLGGLINSLPLVMLIRSPSAPATRHMVAAAQMLWSALLIHLTGGRIETHFHVFGSLAFIAFYRDWRVLVPATLVVAGDHLFRGLLWPESVYGTTNPEWWRFLEHAFWVVFENTILVLACLRGMRELRAIADRQAENEVRAATEKARVAEELERASADLEVSHQALVRSEKLAALGQLAASVGHELRNPLGAIRNANAYLIKRVTAPEATTEKLRADRRVSEFFGVVDKELNSCSRIISDLLDFARERPPERHPCPLRPLVRDAIALVPPRPNVAIHNQVPEEMPVPSLDKDQFRQVMINLVQNASEAIAADAAGEIVVRASGGGDQPWTLSVSDNGQGMPPEIVAQIFQPLFTTKTKGTGLGLAIVESLVRRHEGQISVATEIGRGTTFTLTLPANSAARAAA